MTLVEYGDLKCPFCGQAEPVIRELLTGFGDLRYVWRHLPLSDIHPHAQLAAEASEAAATQGAFWQMHDLLLDHQDRLAAKDLTDYARQVSLNVDRFTDELRTRARRDRITADIESANLSGVAGTPSFFVNGHRQPARMTSSRSAVPSAPHAPVPPSHPSPRTPATNDQLGGSRMFHTVLCRALHLSRLCGETGNTLQPGVACVRVSCVSSRELAA